MCYLDYFAIFTLIDDKNMQNLLQCPRFNLCQLLLGLFVCLLVLLLYIACPNIFRNTLCSKITTLLHFSVDLYMSSLWKFKYYPFYTEGNLCERQETSVLTAKPPYWSIYTILTQFTPMTVSMGGRQKWSQNVSKPP